MTQEAGVPRDFWGRIQKMIEDAVAKLARSGMLRNASISGGALTIKEGGILRVLYPAALGGGMGVYFGDVVSAATGAYLGTGLLVQGPDEKDLMSVRSDVASGTTLVILRDAAENPAFSTDSVAGHGIARPYLANHFVPARFADWAVSTTSATFETLHISTGYRTHAGIMAWTRSGMDTAGQTGEIRVLVNGAQLDTPDPIGFAQTLNFHGPTAPPGNVYDLVTVEIQGRVTSGAGALRVAGGGWIGRPL